MTASPQSVVEDFGWFLDDFDPARREFVFARTTRDEVSRQVFLDARWQRSDNGSLRLPLDAVIASLPPANPPASLPMLNFIWHTSFCCSTLVARALDRPGRSLSLREPKVLVALADALRAGLFPNSLPALTLDAAFTLLGRAPEPGCRITVKPSNFANVLLRQAARRSGGKALFLYSDLASFLVSVAKGGVQQGRYVRRLFGNIAMDLGQPLTWSGAELLALSDLELAAIVWHRQIAEFRRSWAELGDARAVSLDCDAFLDNPGGMLAALDVHFELGLGPEHVRSVLEGPILKSHAKQTSQLFTAQMRRDEDEAVRKRLGASLDEVVAWSYQACPETPRGTPLPNPLAPSSGPGNA